MNQAELATALDGLSTSLTATSAELNKAMAEIVAALSSAGNTTPAVDAAVANLQKVTEALATVAKSLDDLNPDA